VIYIYLPKVPVEPVGGIQTLFDYAERLNQLANKTVAKIVCHERYVRSVLPRSYSLVPVVYQDPVVKPEDTLILPEVLVHMLDQFPAQNKKYLAVLNWKYLEIFSKQLKRPLPQLAGILEKQFPTTPITCIPHVIESQFKVTVPFAKREKNSILILNRKNTHHIPGILAYLEHLPHKVTVVNNLPAEELISLYNQHQIFINLGYPEGFCRPAAEAMACGCVVAGFTGGGGNDFMINGVNSFIASDGDEKELVKILNQILHTLTAEHMSDVSLSARDTIATKYTPATQAKVLYTVFKPELLVKHSVQTIAKLYKSTFKKQEAARKKFKPVYAPSTAEILQFQLFNERQEHKALTSSKFFTLWQKYCALRDGVRAELTGLRTLVSR
jgi:hypothetical protein